MSEVIIDMVIRYLTGESSPEENRQVMAWKVAHREQFEALEKIFNTEFFVNREFDPIQDKKMLLDRINTIEKDLIPQKHKLRTWNYWIRVAAVFIGFIALSIGTYFYDSTRDHLLANQSKSTVDIELPDGSLITLDKGASVHYKLDWLSRFQRDIEFSGRAYFHVYHNPAQPFHILSGNNEVVVLGTEFTIDQNENKFQVILNTGKVEVKAIQLQHNIYLTRHGDQVIINKDGTMKQGQVNTNLYFAWLNKKLEFNNCTVEEALQFLSDSYNIQLELADSVSLSKKLMGSAPSDNPELIVKAISEIVGQEIQK